MLSLKVILLFLFIQFSFLSPHLWSAVLRIYSDAPYSCLVPWDSAFFPPALYCLTIKANDFLSPSSSLLLSSFFPTVVCCDPNHSQGLCKRLSVTPVPNVIAFCLLPSFLSASLFTFLFTNIKREEEDFQSWAKASFKTTSKHYLPHSLSITGKNSDAKKCLCHIKVCWQHD